MLTREANNLPHIKLTIVTPELATKLLERNKLNRPLNEPHVQRIADQIINGKWKFNGDSIKIANGGDVFDGQHRLWAVVWAKRAIDTVIVYGIERDAFATIDTIKKTRSGADILHLCGVGINKSPTATALQWLIRFNKRCMLDYKLPSNRIENSDIEAAFAENPGIVRSVDMVSPLKSIYNRGILAFIYYVLYNRNAGIADRFMRTLEDPAGVGVNDPFFKLRLYFLNHNGRKDAVVSIALSIKAANLAHAGKQTKNLNWKSQGNRIEPFPELDISKH